MDDKDFVNFGDMCRSRLHQQCQYGSRYVDGRIPGYPNLGKGLRFKGESSEYYSIKIHKDDVEEFIKRVEQYREDSVDRFEEIESLYEFPAGRY